MAVNLPYQSNLWGVLPGTITIPFAGVNRSLVLSPEMLRLQELLKLVCRLAIKRLENPLKPVPYSQDIDRVTVGVLGFEECHGGCGVSHVDAKLAIIQK